MADEKSYEESLKSFKEDSSAFYRSGIVLTGIELGVFTALAKGPADAAAVAEQCGTDARSAGAVMSALESMGYLKREGSQFCNTEFAGCALVQGADAYEGDSALMSLWFMRQLCNLTKVAKRGAPLETFEQIVNRDEGMATTLVRAMDQVSRSFCAELTESLDTSSVKKVLDVGGASGVLAAAMLENNPEAVATVLDLPNAAAEARNLIAERGLSQRIDVVEGDFRECDLGEDFDVIFFSNIFHLCNEELCAKLVTKSAKALAPGGRLVIKDMIGAEDGSDTPGLAVYTVLMLLTSEGGSLYPESSYNQWFEAAGLGRAERIDCWERSSLLVARKPS